MADDKTDPSADGKPAEDLTQDEFEAKRLEALAQAAAFAAGEPAVTAPPGPETLEDILEKGRQVVLRNARSLHCRKCGVAIDQAEVCDRCARGIDRDGRVVSAMKTVPREYRQATLGTTELASNVPSETARSLAYVSWSKNRVVIVGASGMGKTTLSVAMLRERAHRGLSIERCLFLPTWKLAVTRSEYVTPAMECDLLVLDDLGSDREFPSSPVTSVIFQRHDDMKATWITTWMTPAQVAERYGDGIARRLFERCVAIDCDARP